MKHLVILTIIFSIGFLLGQYNIMLAFDPTDLYETSIKLAKVSYNVGCNDGTLNLMTKDCKELSNLYETKIRVVNKE